MALHEVGCSFVRREVLDLLEFHGRASTTSQEDATIRYPRLEIGGDYHGLHYEVSLDYTRCGLYLDHRGLIDPESVFNPDLEEYLCREVG